MRETPRSAEVQMIHDSCFKRIRRRCGDLSHKYLKINQQMKAYCEVLPYNPCDDSLVVYYLSVDARKLLP